ncbi:nitroreductase family deazaflavin-dependent oxidoreductase [Trujillonella endophytica]|uniref:Deazaflavin-dependent oxidoreductase, nitroreductase family n=1 Tax=Trujillonella endophytica TaxID=673521 RepID=A0A1H8QLI4_9ACTN|nr:nitroreductase family deazaflavin-dependent oxidoreductase [Trujillella endophytica]SEO54886.1 deazaflavin-dependent oxidoreductase, nitroreductase family [Trujillella endophytica]
MAQYQQIDGTLLNQDHVRVYRETDGEVGYIWNGVPILLLTTTGRKSGEPRTTPLIFARDGDDYLVVASQGGAPTHPNWYLNLLDRPEAEIQVKAERIAVTGRAATEEERPRLWDVVRGPWPNYDVYQERTDRVIPVVVLSPVADGSRG